MLQKIGPRDATATSAIYTLKLLVASLITKKNRCDNKAKFGAIINLYQGLICVLLFHLLNNCTQSDAICKVWFIL